MFSLLPATAHSESVTSVGRLAHIDGRSRVITLSDGSTFHVDKRVKISSRAVGELVVITARRASRGLEVTKIRRAPAEIDLTVETVAVSPKPTN